MLMMLAACGQPASWLGQLMLMMHDSRAKIELDARAGCLLCACWAPAVANRVAVARTPGCGAAVDPLGDHALAGCRMGLLARRAKVCPPRPIEGLQAPGPGDVTGLGVRYTDESPAALHVEIDGAFKVAAVSCVMRHHLSVKVDIVDIPLTAAAA